MYRAELKLPRITVHVEAADVLALWDEMAAVAEVFGEAECGVCKNAHIRPGARTASKGKQTYVYREWVCGKCGAKLNLGQQEGGRMFPKRKLKPNGEPVNYKLGEDGEVVNNGWTKWRGAPADAHDDDPPPAQSPPGRQPPRR